MALWLVRAGSTGEFEQKFLNENKIYVTWNELKINLVQLSSKKDLVDQLSIIEPDAKHKKLLNHASQIWPFAHEMAVGDRVILPSKLQPVVYIGVIKSEYKYTDNKDEIFPHSRTVEWIKTPIPRSNFSQDLLYSFGAFMTICRIQRNNAEERISSMQRNNWAPETQNQIIYSNDNEEATNETDLEEVGKNQIIKIIEARFKGHNLTRLIKSILVAQGYTCWQSPEGADGGVDILASSGPMGFGGQQICVEVKSGNELVDRSTVDKLIGAMTKFNAQQGLFVAWGGFKSNVHKELASSFFRVRLWSQNELLEQLFNSYDKLDEEIKAELPLKRVWTIADLG